MVFCLVGIPFRKLGKTKTEHIQTYIRKRLNEGKKWKWNLKEFVLMLYFVRGKNKREETREQYIYIYLEKAKRDPCRVTSSRKVNQANTSWIEWLNVSTWMKSVFFCFCYHIEPQHFEGANNIHNNIKLTYTHTHWDAHKDKLSWQWNGSQPSIKGYITHSYIYR